MTTTRTNAEESHRNLREFLADTIRPAYRRAVEAGMDDPVALVLDLNDEEARSIAEAAGRGAEIAEHIARSRAAGQPPIALWHLPRELVEALIAPFAAPLVADLHNEPVVDEILVVVATAEMTSLAALPMRGGRS